MWEGTKYKRALKLNCTAPSPSPREEENIHAQRYSIQAMWLSKQMNIRAETQTTTLHSEHNPSFPTSNTVASDQESQAWFLLWNRQTWAYAETIDAAMVIFGCPTTIVKFKPHLLETSKLKRKLGFFQSPNQKNYRCVNRWAHASTQEQTNSSISWKTEIDNSYFPNIFNKKVNSDFWEVRVGDWQSLGLIFFSSLRGNKCFTRVNDRHWWSPGGVSYATIPRCCPNATFYSIVASILYGCMSICKLRDLWYKEDWFCPRQKPSVRQNNPHNLVFSFSCWI